MQKIHRNAPFPSTKITNLLGGAAPPQTPPSHGLRPLDCTLLSFPSRPNCNTIHLKLGCLYYMNTSAFCVVLLTKTISFRWVLDCSLEVHGEYSKQITRLTHHCSESKMPLDKIWLGLGKRTVQIAVWQKKSRWGYQARLIWTYSRLGYVAKPPGIWVRLNSVHTLPGYLWDLVRADEKTCPWTDNQLYYSRCARHAMTLYRNWKSYFAGWLDVGSTARQNFKILLWECCSPICTDQFLPFKCYCVCFVHIIYLSSFCYVVTQVRLSFV